MDNFSHALPCIMFLVSFSHFWATIGCLSADLGKQTVKHAAKGQGSSSQASNLVLSFTRLHGKPYHYDVS